MAETIAITGATGFVGAAVARRLTAAGHRIQALIRPASTHKKSADITAKWIEGDLDAGQSLHRLVDGVDVVIHCAGAVRGATQEQFNRVNADGLAHLIRAMVDQNPRPRLLSMSSLAAREPHLSPYAASKRQGERIIAEQGQQLSWTIYRPSAVYGPGDREILPVLKWMTRGIAPVLGSGNGRFSLIYVKDLAEAVVKWLDHGGCQSGTYELHDGHPGGYSWHDVIDMVKHHHSKALVCLKIPLALVKLVAAVNLLAARTIGYAPMLTPGKVCELSHPDWVCDNTALNSATGWSPQILLPEGLKRTLNWEGI
jgi:nucleoside-diphosphate-sugar epimerase